MTMIRHFSIQELAEPFNVSDYVPVWGLIWRCRVCRMVLGEDIEHVKRHITSHQVGYLE
jgi:hypothetical protein